MRIRDAVTAIGLLGMLGGCYSEEFSRDNPSDPGANTYVEKTPETGNDADGDGYSETDDCDDENPDIYPGADELCNGADDDCDGDVDDDLELFTYYADNDGDGYGSGDGTERCNGIDPGETDAGGDCDDDDPDISPGADEVCNEIDDDCDDDVDEGLRTDDFYVDRDGDGYGDDNTSPVEHCGPAEDGEVTRGGDCDDRNADVNPSADEVCGDSVDNDCDGIDLETEDWYRDADGDQVGDGEAQLSSCTTPPGYVQEAGDCNDDDPTIYPGALDLCDGLDNDCDGEVDELSVPYFADNDGDGYGAGEEIVACEPVQGMVTNNEDCDDGSAEINPGAVESCNQIDDNCSGEVDEGVSFTYLGDFDGDGFGGPDEAVQVCFTPIGYVLDQGGPYDCNDTSDMVYPGADEACDGVDNDCDNDVDEGVKREFYKDTDGDLYGDPDAITLACEVSPGAVENNEDCDDSRADVNPGTTETPEMCGDGIDQDCNGYDLGCDNVDVDNDGYQVVEGDCDDTNAATYPGANERCDREDNDCDGIVDNKDEDGDGAIDLPCGGGDCDDERQDVAPGAEELCDGLDNDCNGIVDDRDSDEDGANAAECGGIDCDDDDPEINPGATEVCDGQDNNCDGEVDEGLDKTSYYQDTDLDGHGNPASETEPLCEAPTPAAEWEWSDLGDDCDDSNDLVYPDADERFDGVANDCGEEVDLDIPLETNVTHTVSQNLVPQLTNLGQDLVVASIDQEEGDDLLVKATWNGANRYYLWSSAAFADGNVAEYSKVFMAGEGEEAFAAQAGDFDGDGAEDIVISGVGPTSPTGYGLCYFLGVGVDNEQREYTTDNAVCFWFEDVSAYWGTSLLNLGDLKGDGKDTLVLADPGAYDGTGRVMMVELQDTSMPQDNETGDGKVKYDLVTVLDLVNQLEPGVGGLGVSLAAGYDSIESSTVLWIGASDLSAPGEEARGWIYAVYPIDYVVAPTSAPQDIEFIYDVWLMSGEVSAGLGRDVATIGDVTYDSNEDLLITAFEDDGSRVVYLVPGSELHKGSLLWLEKIGLPYRGEPGSLEVGHAIGGIGTMDDWFAGRSAIGDFAVAAMRHGESATWLELQVFFGTNWDANGGTPDLFPSPDATMTGYDSETGFEVSFAYGYFNAGSEPDLVMGLPQLYSGSESTSAFVIWLDPYQPLVLID